MNRNSRRAQNLVATLDTAGINLRGRTVTGRMLEELDTEGFLPEDDGRIVAYVGALDALDYGRGKSADETCLRMLARGMMTGRARKVLSDMADDLGNIRTLLAGIDPPAPVVAPYRPTSTLGPPMRKIADAVADAPVGGRVVDYTGRMAYETPEGRAATFGGAIQSLLTGRRPDPDGTELAIDILHSPAGPFYANPKRYHREPSEDELNTAEDVFTLFGTALHITPDIIATATNEDLTMAAQMAAAMWRALPVPIPGFGEREREIIGATLAPMVLGMLRAGWEPHPDKMA